MTDELKDALENHARQAQDLALIWQATEEAFRSSVDTMANVEGAAGSLARSLQGLEQTMATAKVAGQLLHELGWVAQSYLGVAEAAAARMPTSADLQQRLMRATDLVATLRGLDPALQPLLQDRRDEDSSLRAPSDG